MTHVARRTRLADHLPRAWQQALNAIVFFLLPLFTYLMIESLFRRETDPIRPDIAFLNYILYLVLLALLTALTGRLRWGVRLFALVTWFMGTANYAVIAFRSTPLMPWDLASANTAFSVAENYTFPFETPWIIFTLFSLFVCLIASLLTWRLLRPRVHLVAATALIALSLGTFSVASSEWTTEHFNLDQTLFNSNYMSRHNGFLANFIHATHYLSVDEPSGYSLESIEALEAQYRVDEPEVRDTVLESEPEPTGLYRAPGDYDAQVKRYLEIANGPARTQLEPGERPDIVIVMNESFSDMQDLYPFTSNLPQLTFYNHLVTDTIKGTVHPSVVGGNTASSEFEFLTGSTMAFLPSGSIAYQQYIVEPLPNLTTHLKDLGYRTHAMHPYYATGWKRDTVYPLLGFDHTRFLGDFQALGQLRDYMSDETLYRQILMDLADNQGAPNFIFSVTMQNHGGYTQDYANFNPEVQMIDPPSHKALDVFLSLIRESDRALGSFLATLKDRPQPTLVVFFGDHQPNDYTAAPLSKYLSGDALQDHRRRTPYAVWANYELDDTHERATSINYLGPIALEAARLPMTPWYRFLDQLQTDIPVINDAFYFTPDGRRHRIADGLTAGLETYPRFQYHLLFDVERRIESMFTHAR